MTYKVKNRVLLGSVVRQKPVYVAYMQQCECCRLASGYSIIN